MMDPIEFLDRLGSNARLRHAAPGEIEKALDDANIDPALRSAMLADDALRLGELLGAQRNVCCLIVKPDPDEEEEDEEEDEKEDDKSFV